MRPTSDRRPDRQRDPAPVGAPPAPRVGHERIEALTQQALESMDPNMMVRVVFEGEPLQARFLCLRCECFLMHSRAQWVCGTCIYALREPQARMIVTQSHRMLDELLGVVAGPKDVGLVAAPPKAAPEGWWTWLSSRLSRIWSARG